MISPLIITSLTQGKLYGEKPTIDELDGHGAIIHQSAISAWMRYHLVVEITRFAVRAGAIRKGARNNGRLHRYGEAIGLGGPNGPGGV